MYTTFLDHTLITSKKKTHLARRTFPQLLEEMGYIKLSIYWWRNRTNFTTVFLQIKSTLQVIGREILSEKCTAQKYQKWYVNICDLDSWTKFDWTLFLPIGSCFFGWVSGWQTLQCALGRSSSARITPKASFSTLWGRSRKTSGAQL